MVRSIFTFKMLAITYDTIALFYIFSSLFLGDASDPGAIEVPFLNRSLDPLSAVWLYGMVFITVWLYAVWLIFGIDIAFTDWEKRMKVGEAHHRRRTNASIPGSPPELRTHHPQPTTSQDRNEQCGSA